MAFANLHTHTIFSDASLDPADLVRAVYAEPGLEIFALTDHDSMSGIEPAFRARSRLEKGGATRPKRFLPGIELSLRHGTSGLVVHLLGFFPQVGEENYQEELSGIEKVLGEHCRYRCLNRGGRDLDQRVRIAFMRNLGGLAESYGSPEQVIDILRAKAEEKNQRLLRAVDKQGDVIQHPIPITYQTFIDFWEEIMPGSSKEKITLYNLRADRTRIQRLSRIYVSEGMDEGAAMERAREDQGILISSGPAPFKEMDLMEGLALLHQAGAVTALAHPAVDHLKVTYDDFDRIILYPMVARGLKGIEVFYPYDPTFRDEAIAHYGAIARKQGLLVSGGTDYHGDGRTGLADVKLDIQYAQRIMHHRSMGPSEDE